MKKLITKNSYLIFFFLTTTNFLFGQVTDKVLPKLKINLNSGITYTRFYGKQPFELVRCIEGCTTLEQTTKPAFALGGTITKLIGSRHYLGVGYNYYRIKIDHILSDHFVVGTLLKKNLVVNYHSFYVLHQYLIKPNNGNLYWNNSIGVDFTDKHKPINNRALFYRTGLEYNFYWGDLKLALNPYLQIGLTPYSEDIYEKKTVMRPFSFGLNFTIPLEF